MLNRFEIAVALCIMIGSAAAGWHARTITYQAAERKAQAAAQKETGLLQRGANQADAALIDRLIAEKDRANERANNLERQLRGAGAALGACSIDSDTLRVLNDELSRPAGVTRVGEPDAPAVATSATCADLARAYDANRGAYQLVIEQLGACRQFYLDVRREYCAATKAC